MRWKVLVLFLAACGNPLGDDKVAAGEDWDVREAVDAGADGENLDVASSPSAWRTSGDGVLGAEVFAYADGSGVVVLHHAGRVDLPDGTSLDGDPEIPSVSLVWVGASGVVSAARPVVRGMTLVNASAEDDVVFFTLGFVSPSVVFTGQQPMALDDWQSQVIAVRPGGVLEVVADVVGDGFEASLSSYATMGGVQVVAGLVSNETTIVRFADGQSVEIPGNPSLEGPVRPAWMARREGDEVAVTVFGGSAASKVLDVEFTEDGDVWACIDFGGPQLQSDLVLNPGWVTEQRLVANRDGDKPSSQLALARLGEDLEVRRAWTFDSKTTQVWRTCHLALMGNQDVVVSSRVALPEGVAAFDGEVAVVRRLSEDGAAIWTRALAAGDSASPVVVGDGLLNLVVPVEHGGTILPGTAMEQVVSAQPQPQFGVNVAVRLDEDGQPVSVVSGGYGDVALTRAGRMFVAAVGTHEAAWGSGSAAALGCPASDVPRLCFGVVTPRDVRGSTFWQ